MKTIKEEPDFILESEDGHKDILKIYKTKKELVFNCNVDGTGNTWGIPLNEIRELLK